MPPPLPILEQTNRIIRDVAGETQPPDVLWQFVCECGCYELVELTLGQYDALGHAFVAGHEPTARIAAVEG